MKNNDYKIKIEQRLTRVETTLQEISENHLPTLEKKIDRIQWLLVITLIGVIVELLTRLT